MPGRSGRVHDRRRIGPQPLGAVFAGLFVVCGGLCYVFGRSVFANDWGSRDAIRAFGCGGVGGLCFGFVGFGCRRSGFRAGARFRGGGSPVDALMSAAGFGVSPQSAPPSSVPDVLAGSSVPVSGVDPGAEPPSDILKTREAMAGRYFRRSDDQYVRPETGTPYGSYVFYWGSSGLGGPVTVDLCDGDGARHNDFEAAGTNWRGTVTFPAGSNFDCSIVGELHGTVISVQIDGTSDVWSFPCDGVFIMNYASYYQLYCVGYSQGDGFAEPPGSYGNESNPTVTVSVAPENTDVAVQSCS